MRMFKVIGLAVFACVAFATAASSASAAPAEILITTGQNYPQLFLSSSTKESKLFSLNAAGSAVEKEVHCTSLLNHGFLRSPTDLLVLLLFHNCLTEAFGATLPCKSAGETGSLIHVLLLALPVWLNAAKTLPGLLFEKHPGLSENIITEFECASGIIKAKVQVRGTVLGHLKPGPKVKANKVEVNVETNGKAGLVQTFDKVEEGSVLDHLEANENGGAFKPATEEVLEDLIHFNEGVEVEFH